MLVSTGARPQPDVCSADVCALILPRFARLYGGHHKKVSSAAMRGVSTERNQLQHDSSTAVANHNSRVCTVTLCSLGVANQQKQPHVDSTAKSATRTCFCGDAGEQRCSITRISSAS
jgi:hypothetical protein